MTHLLPIVEQLADAETVAERAEWLLTIPDCFVIRDFDPIRLILQENHFLAGVDYLRARHAILHATRGKDGMPDYFLRATVTSLRRDMIRLARPASERMPLT